MKVGFDSNILIYSFDKSDSDKQARARELIPRILADRSVVPMQVISETLNAAHRKRHLSVPDARLACQSLAQATGMTSATPEDADHASILAERFKLQYFDAQMIAVQAKLGVKIFLSEDMQDGLRIDGLQILDPFNSANSTIIDAEMAR